MIRNISYFLKGGFEKLDWREFWYDIPEMGYLMLEFVVFVNFGLINFWIYLNVIKFFIEIMLFLFKIDEKREELYNKKMMQL